jgi:hypothetical protein
MGGRSSSPRTPSRRSRGPAVEEIRAPAPRAEASRHGARPEVAYEGSVDPLVKALAHYEVRAIRGREDDLEAIFLNHYRDGEDR